MMIDESSSKAQLMEEINALRWRVHELESSTSGNEQVEEALRESEERYRCLSEATFEGIAITEKGVVIDANERLANMLGYSRDEILGMDVMEMVAPESRGLVHERILSGYETPYEHLAIRKDSSTFFVEARGKATSYKGHTVRVTSIRDVTERKQAEEAYRVLVESSLQSLVILQDGRIVFVNHAAEVSTGYTSKELLGMEDPLQILIHPDDLPGRLDRVARFARGETVPPQAIYRVIEKNGQVHWVEAYTTRIEWRGKPAAHATFIDITNRRQAEEAYHALVESSLQALVIMQDGHIIFANPAAEILAGYSVEELLSMESPIQTLIHPDELPGILERGARRASGEVVPPLAIYRILRKNGQIRWVESYTQQIELNGKPADHTVYIDITERKQAEDELRRVSQDENKRRQELEKLRDISTNMRQADSSNNLLEIFTNEVRELFNSDIAASIQFKTLDSPVFCFRPDGDDQFDRKQLETIKAVLYSAKTGNFAISIEGFDSIIILPLQSSDKVYGATLVASHEADAFTLDEQNMLNAIADMAGTGLHRIDILETLEERVQQRTHDLVVLYNLITIISENWRLQDILELSLVLTLETVKADRGIIYLADGKESPDLKPVIQRGFANGFQIESSSLPDSELARQVFKREKALTLGGLADIPDQLQAVGLNSYAGIPILVRGEVRGVFSLFAREKDVFGSEEMALLASIADHLGIGIDNSILWEQSRENAALEERNRLARNLHDSVSQLLYSLTLMAGTTRKMLEHSPDLDAVKKSVERFGDTAHQALKEMRLLLYELRPGVLDSEGLVSALQHRIDTVENRLGVKVDLQANGLPKLPSNVEDALYHIALEALNNIVKHSGNTESNIKFTSNPEKVVMEISDHGRGFETDRPHAGQGLRNMHERVQMLGGEIEVESTPGSGTLVKVTVGLVPGSLIES